MTKILLALIAAAAFVQPAHALSANVDLGVGVTVGSTTSADTTTSGTVDIGGDTTTTNTTGAINIDIAPTQVMTDADLEVYTKAVAEGDENVGTVQATEDEVTVSYRERLYLFGFIPVSGTVHATAEAGGTVKVKYPWYSFLASHSRAEVETRVQNSVDVALQGAETSGSFSVRTRAALVSAMRSALKTSYEADLSASAKAHTE